LVVSLTFSSLNRTLADISESAFVPVTRLLFSVIVVVTLVSFKKIVTSD